MKICTECKILGLNSNGDRLMKCKFICDTYADIPTATEFQQDTGCIIAMGSKAHIIFDNADYELQSSGSWTLSQSGTAAYTKSEVDQLLSYRLPLLNSDYTPLVTSQTWDLFTLPPGVYYRTSSISSVLNIPSDLSSAFFCIVTNTIGTNRRQILLFPCTSAVAGIVYRVLETGSGYGSWYKFTGSQVI